jgi:hypothetical protein
MARWTSYETEPSSVGEPQSVRDAWDKQLQAQAEADAELKAALAEIEAG